MYHENSHVMYTGLGLSGSQQSGMGLNIGCGATCAPAGFRRLSSRRLCVFQRVTSDARSLYIELTFVEGCSSMCDSLLHMISCRWAQRMGLMEGLSGSCALWACLSTTKESLLRCCLDLVSPERSQGHISRARSMESVNLCVITCILLAF